MPSGNSSKICSDLIAGEGLDRDDTLSVRHSGHKLAVKSVVQYDNVRKRRYRNHRRKQLSRRSKLNKTCLLAISVALSLLSIEPVLGQDNPLSVFEEFTSSKWEGHYSNPEDSHLVHIVRFEFYLDSLAVVLRKNVPELGFEKETYFYPDWSNGNILFLSLMNKKMISRGEVTFVDGQLVLAGQTLFETGESDFKNTYEIDDTGQLIDRFYRKRDGEWIRGHTIVHVPMVK